VIGAAASIAARREGGPDAAPFTALRVALSAYGPPVVVFNKSHSGSRLLARLLARSGVFMGAELNESEDAVPILPIVQRLVVDHYPDYRPLLASGDAALEAAILEAFATHLRGFPGGRWGWKLCETTYILPVLHAIFPEARYVHLIRDGRDVAFSDHVWPRSPFWKKVYFDTADIRSWRGMPLASIPYKLLAPLYNARHWVNSVTVGRRAGLAMGSRYLEIRYEDLVADFPGAAARLLGALDLPADAAMLKSMSGEVSRGQVGKFRQRSRFHNWLAMLELEPALAAFGYGEETEPSRRAS
jgi:LPS sulfotransferase NodH